MSANPVVTAKQGRPGRGEVVIVLLLAMVMIVEPVLLVEGPRLGQALNSPIATPGNSRASPLYTGPIGWTNATPGAFAEAYDIWGGTGGGDLYAAGYNGGTGNQYAQAYILNQVSGLTTEAISGSGLCNVPAVGPDFYLPYGSYGWDPQGVAIDPSSNDHWVYLAFSYLTVMSGTSQDVCFNSTTNIPDPYAVAYDPALGEVVVTSPQNHSVYLIFGNTIEHEFDMRKVGLSSCDSPAGLVYNPANEEMYVACISQNSAYTGFIVIDSTGNIGTSFNTVYFDPSDDPFVYDPVSQNVFMFGEGGGAGGLVEINHSSDVASTVPIWCDPEAGAESGEGAAYSGSQIGLSAEPYLGPLSGSNGGDVLITCPAASAIAYYNTRSNGSYAPPGAMGIVGGPKSITYDPISGGFYVVLFQSSNPTVALMIDPVTNLVQGRLEIAPSSSSGHVEPVALVVSNLPDAAVYSCNYILGSITEMPVFLNVSYPSAPTGIAFSDNIASETVVTNGLADSVAAFLGPGLLGSNASLGVGPVAVATCPFNPAVVFADNTSTNQVFAIWGLGSGGPTWTSAFVTAPTELVCDPWASGLLVLSPSTDSVTLINGLSGAPIGSVTVGTDPDCMMVWTPTDVLVANYGSNNITVLGVTSASIVHLLDVAVGIGPDAITSDAANNLFVANYGSNNVTVLDAAYNHLTDLAVTPTGGGPVALAVDGADNYLWIADYSSGYVVTFDLSNYGVEGDQPAAGGGIGYVTDVQYDPTTGDVWALVGVPSGSSLVWNVTVFPTATAHLSAIGAVAQIPLWDLGLEVPPGMIIPVTPPSSTPLDTLSWFDMTGEMYLICPTSSDFSIL